MNDTIAFTNQSNHQIDIDYLETNSLDYCIRTFNVANQMHTAVFLKNLVIELLNAQTDAGYTSIVERPKFWFRDRLRSASLDGVPPPK